jgi:hypothetical protein
MAGLTACFARFFLIRAHAQAARPPHARARTDMSRDVVDEESLSVTSSVFELLDE